MQRSSHSKSLFGPFVLCVGLLAALACTPEVRAQATATVTTLHFFAKDVNGQQPKAGLLLARDGNFYGTTSIEYNQGTLFKLAPNGTFTSLYQFGFNLNPDSELIQSSDGSIYGTANGSGGVSPRHGAIFRLAPDGTVSIVHYFNADNSFTESSDPVNCGLTQAKDGFLYGVTTFGGSTDGGFGTFYRLNADNTITVLHRFVPATEGNGPQGRLVQASDGNFYGITTAGGTYQLGTVFRLTPGGALTVLHTFRGHPSADETRPEDGSEPLAGLVQGSDGYLYGATSGGGGGLTPQGYPDGDHGTIFRISLAGQFTLMHSFLYTDGVSPNARLIQGKDGNFYGNAGSGGQGDANGNGALGTIFQMKPDGTFTTLHTFTGPDGGSPLGNLAQATDGSFYGTTSNGSTNDTGRYGTIFKFKVSGTSHPGFFKGEVALANGVYYLSFPNQNYFGYYSYLADPNYIYHFDLGYEYVFPAADGNNGVYLYDFKSGGFFYTSPTFPFPYLYDFTLNTVLYYYPDPDNAGHYNTDGFRFFYRFDTGQIIVK